nr:endo-1,4-beta-xylanase [Pedobacter glucosidilyticus]
MKNTIIKSMVLFALGTTVLSSCQREVEFNSLNKGNFTDTVGSLQAVADFPIGFAADNPTFESNAAYRRAIVSNASMITFENSMKHNAIVRDNGTFDFTRADALATAATAAGLKIHGHTLVWHSQQNGTYLSSLGGTAPPPRPNILLNGGFESGTGADYTNWSKFNGAASFSAGSGGEVRTGTRSMKAVVATDNPGGQWRVQLASDLFPTTVGVDYRVTFFIRAATAGGTMRLSTAPSAQFQGDQTVGTDWTPISWTFRAQDAQTRILFDMGARANTYFVDDVTVVDATPVPGVDLTQVRISVDNAMKAFIQGMINRYKSRGVVSWDVLNEILAENGTLRDGTNSPTEYYWVKFLGRDYIANAFRYAREADPNADLYINDFNLEQGNQLKVDSMVALCNRLKAQNVPITGIGTQMHITTNSSRAGIINSLRKLASTGLKVKITELDIRVNVGNAAAFTPDEFTLALQAEMYKFVVETYLKYVPAAQRGGITIWGVDDPRGWLNRADRPEFALLFNANFTKKPAYAGVKMALQGK